MNGGRHRRTYEWGISLKNIRVGDVTGERMSANVTGERMNEGRHLITYE